MFMELKSLVFIFFLGVLLSTPNITCSVGAVCNERERKALLTFKQHLKDTSNLLSSWAAGTNCCRWNGIICDNKTESSVVQLRLHGLSLSGELNPSLLELKHLNHLDLSQNDFQGISIPAYLGSLQNLRYLNLASAGFVGIVPHQLGNLSSLRYLNMNGAPYRVDYMGQIHSTYQNLTVDGELEWFSHLSSLQHLDMSRVDISKASSNWLHSINMLPSLLELNLSSCKLDSIPSLPYINFTSLEILDLSSNGISSNIPEWLYNLSSLEQLYLDSNNCRGTISAAVGDLTALTRLNLSYNEFEGKVPRTLGNLCNLQTLDLSKNKLHGEISVFFQNSSGCIAGSLESLNLGFNQLSGSIPSSLGSYSLLKKLDLRNNELNGSLPKSLSLLSNLRSLLISYNTFEGIVTEFHFAGLWRLRVLEMDSLVLKLRADWIPPFQLEVARLRTCHLGPRFPEWLRTQEQIEFVDLSSNKISGTVPTWFWNMSSQITYLNLSNNHLTGELPNLLKSPKFSGIYLSSNLFTGQLPLISSHVAELDLSNNSISGPISVLLCNPVGKMNLEVLVLSGNLLSGELPECWSYWKFLRLITLGSNNITGKIPISMGSLLKLQSLHLQNNSLFGELPSSLRNCIELVTINLCKNGFTGSIPKWIGESLSKLMFLRLRLNKFHGGIPQELCHLTSLQLLDLAHNNLSGSIPRCFNNLSAMVSKRNSSALIFPSVVTGTLLETAALVTKGIEVMYSNTLALVTSMDLSNNSLSGEIPEELTSLFGLRSLNLSENHFTGKIPDKIGGMSLLESLDFSYNKLSGLIPQSMVNLTFLGHLNLSYNNLSGEIPSSTQLQGFFESYMGNQGLCGRPLPNKCNGDEQPQPPAPGDEDEDEDWVEMKWFYVSLPLGFVVGFWGFWGVLIVKKSWRLAYFAFVGDVIDKLYNCCSSFKPYL
ncbi:Leucine-rich repeat [Macleaya cordata]|uniref:Leucine-rich repeat n=1 Tax=Macleaya cordata TaxID=56857 RepID=A0A200QUF8_MACCD|nr:Leucine-rich repeat [Macleaya cordata]